MTTRHRILSALALLLGGAGCQGANHVEETPAGTRAQPGSDLHGAEASKPIDARSQYALAAALTAPLSGEQELDPVGAMGVLRAAWEGQRYRWEVALNPVLCSRADRCVVFPFDHGKPGDRIVVGWMPRLELTEEDHKDLLGRCGDLPVCVLEFEGTLAEFTLSAEDPTSLRFADVQVQATRAPLEGESWVRRKADPRVEKLRTQRAG